MSKREQRKRARAAAEVERWAKGLFDALNLKVGYDTLTIELGRDGTFGPWRVSIDNDNCGGERVLHEDGRTLAAVMEAATGEAARAHLIASASHDLSESR